MKARALPIIVMTLLMSAVSPMYAVDLNRLYESDYDSFWTKWRDAEKKAMSCTDYDMTARFLSNAILMLGNAEVSEANAKSVERLSLEKPRCLLESIQKLSAEDQIKFVKFFILTPLFHDGKEIIEVLEKHWNKYENIRELYWRLKQGS